MNIFDLLKECKDLAKRCNLILDHSGWSKWNDIDSDLYDRSDCDQRFLVDCLYAVCDLAERLSSSVEYLTREEVQIYCLHLSSSGRPVCYEMDCYVAHEYHCGYRIEYLAPNPDYDPEYPDWDPCPELWHLSSIEHDGVRYCIVGDPDLDLDGLTVRVRERFPF